MVMIVEMLAAGVLAYFAAGMIYPFNVAVVLFVLSYTIEFLRVRLREKRKATAIIGALCNVIVAGTVLVAAALHKPSKTVEKRLDRIVTLESTEMSLAQLESYCSSQRKQFPSRVSLTFADEDKDTVVTWPSQTLTLREFIGSIESQTRLRHTFYHCGNGWTLLHGGDCCFGLGLRDTELTSAWPPKKKVYHSDWEYVPEAKKTL